MGEIVEFDIDRINFLASVYGDMYVPETIEYEYLNQLEW